MLDQTPLACKAGSLATTNPSGTMKLSIDHSHHFELLRILGHAYYGGSDVQEVLQIAGRLTPGDDEGWYGSLERTGRKPQGDCGRSAGKGI
ncbi:hypothetical protein ACU4GD_04705 [Cupriavidus basilensis]